MVPLQVNHADPLPLHVQIERLLRKLIVDPTYRQGAPLPAEVELAGKLGVGRQTVRQAMQKLVHEGLIERRRNAGTRVTPRNLTTRLSDWGSFTAEMSRQGVALDMLTVSASQARPPVAVAEFFNIPRARKCLHLHRVRGDRFGPVVEFHSWLHPRLQLKPTDDFTQPLYELIERRAHVIVAHSHEQISARLPDARLRQVLCCSAHQPLLTRLRRVLDVGRRAVEWCECTYRADRFTYSIEIQREMT